MEIKQLSVTDVSQHITIGHHKGRFRARVKQAQRTRCSQRRLLVQIVDPHAQATAITKIRLDHVPQIVNSENKVYKSFEFRPLDNVLQHGFSRHQQHRFWTVFGMRAQTRTLAAGHDDHQV